MNFNSMVDRIKSVSSSGDLILRKRLLEIADNVSNSARTSNRLLFFNEVIFSITSILYEKNNNRLININELSGKILIPVPWGANGCREWGVTRWEAGILRNILFVKMRSIEIVPLYQYADDLKRWTINLIDYPTADKALEHIKKHPINVLEYELACSLVRDSKSKS